jgi:hypothetical protein
MAVLMKVVVPRSMMKESHCHEAPTSHLNEQLKCSQRPPRLHNLPLPPLYVFVDHVTWRTKLDCKFPACHCRIDHMNCHHNRC